MSASVASIRPLPPAYRYETLDHWRGLAALAVIFHHTPLFSYQADAPAVKAAWLVALYQLGWWGVPVFFAISGYCVMAAADRAPSVVTYFKRRLRRIYPPYFATLLLLAVAWFPLRSLLASEPYPVPSPISLAGWAWVGNLTLSVIWLPRVVGQTLPVLLGPAWTLCYEEGYYAIVGVLLAAFGRRGLAVGVVTVTAAVFVVYRRKIDVDDTPIDVYWLAFAAGAIAYHAVTRPARRRTIYTIALALAALLLLARTPKGHLIALHATPMAGGAIGSLAAVILLAVHPFDRPLARLAALRPLQWCGQRCYSIYLVHWPVCKTLAVAMQRAGWTDYAALWPLATLPASLAVGHVFHVVVERRFLNTRPSSPEAPNPPA